MSGIEIIGKGDSLPFVFDRNGLDISGWICTLEVKQYPADVAIISRVITPTNGVWEGFLTSTETDTLTAGITYRMVAVLTNATTVEEEQVVVRFFMRVSWAA
jgi:hypothetical protein